MGYFSLIFSDVINFKLLKLNVKKNVLSETE